MNMIVKVVGTILDDIADGPACNIPLAEGEIDCEGKPLGTVFGACLGIDDVVEVSFTVNVEVSSAQSDVGLYINLNGGDAAFGDTSLGTSPVYSPGVNDVCTVAQLTEIGFELIVGHDLTDNDECLDFIGSGNLINYPFQRLVLGCSDTNGDGLLDFNVAASFSQNAAADCSFNNTNINNWGPPIPGTRSKCWYDSATKVTLDINVPPCEL